MHGVNEIPSREIVARHQLAHDLLSPIRAIAIYADLMELGLQSPTPNAVELEKYCREIVAMAGELAGLVDDFADEPT